MIDKLMILYFSGFDYQKINSRITPHLYSLSEKYPIVKINTIPDVDLKTTMWTGRYPHEHGMWQVRIKDGYDFDAKKFQDYFPDICSTTLQCLVHAVTGKFNLVSVPNWRRRRFDIFKTKYTWNDNYGLFSYNGVDSIFNIIGKNNYSFVYENRYNEMINALSKEPVKDKKLGVFDAHGTDVFTHWNIDDEEKMNEAYMKVDGLIKYILEECENKGATLMLLSDHAQAKVEDTIDIAGKIEELGIKKNEITYFIEATKARFWFHTDSARQKMLDYLSSNEKGALFHFEELYRYGIEFNDDSYGEYYFITNPGVIFYPNDYYHPIGNIFLALKNQEQRARLKSPIYRGYHGHLPHNQCEKGFVMLVDSDYKPIKEEIDIIDIAPTVLNLLGYRKPDSLTGKHAFNKL